MGHFCEDNPAKIIKNELKTKTLRHTTLKIAKFLNLIFKAFDLCHRFIVHLNRVYSGLLRCTSYMKAMFNSIIINLLS